MDPKILEIRKEIDQLDTEIISLLARRFHLTGEVGKIKAQDDTQIQDPDREANLKAMYQDLAAQKGLDPEMVTRIFEKIHEESRADQAA